MSERHPEQPQMTARDFIELQRRAPRKAESRQLGHGKQYVQVLPDGRRFFTTEYYTPEGEHMRQAYLIDPLNLQSGRSFEGRNQEEGQVGNISADLAAVLLQTTDNLLETHPVGSDE
jgi:hypothetical protein